MTKEKIIGILLNVLFITSIVGIRYKYVKEEYDFLKDDSDRQESLIQNNKNSMDSLSLLIDDLKLANELQDDRLFEMGRWNDKYEDKIQRLIDTLETMKLDISSVESATVPFLQEFGTQDIYIKVFGRTGLRIQNNKIVESKTITDFEGNIELGSPEIEQLGKYEFKATYPNRQVFGLSLRGGESKTIKLKPPRNQISIGPMFGVTYNSSTGLTSPIWGIGVTYNMVKLWDWK
ncbi:MAG: hypothetical protein H8E03_01270 [Pelagibacteraceae bacterium]|nr:hypothetical protein [Pelagibacteraceae bacterium]